VSYVPLGARSSTGVQDATGNNTGNYTVSFAPADLDINVPYFEVYKIVIHGQIWSNFTVWVDSKQFDVSQQGYSNAWEPEGGTLQLNPGNTLYFYWSTPVSTLVAPTVTIWLRYDNSLPGNPASYSGG
jgi:hypothetical protein